jgi:hypothetical protein
MSFIGWMLIVASLPALAVELSAPIAGRASAAAVRDLPKYHAVGDPHYRGNALVLQTPHDTGGIGRARDQGRMGRGPVAARLLAAAGCHDSSKMGHRGLSGAHSCRLHFVLKFF